MGKKWDDLTGSGGFSSTGIGERPIPWPSYGADTTNPSCRTCGGRMRGVRACVCDKPDWHVKGESYDPKAKKVARNALQQEWHLQWLTEARRVIRPGGVIKAFSGTRTFHRLAAAMEDAGFAQVRIEAWTYGSGFPKSLNVSKAFDKAAGVLAHEGKNMRDVAEGLMALRPTTDAREYVPPEPVTREAIAWRGWGTALKPAWEPVVVGVKP